GGGGGTVTPPPASGNARLAADAVEIGSAATVADVTVQLASAPAEGACLLQVAVELPPELTLPANDRLQAAQPLPTLDGDFAAGRFVVLCGDAQNVAAANLALGPLFRLRLTPASPRQPGTYTVRFVGLKASTRDGTAVPADTNPTVVSVIVR
ncbi:MAG: hypothetical protein WBO45_00070, partial [Planctomycetota bacterium]